MTPRSERDVILDHALRDEENLDLALKICSAYTDLCDRVIVGFLEAVRAKLAVRLGGTWKVSVGDPSHFATRWVTFLGADFLGHPGQFELIIGGDESGYPKKVFIAVRSASCQDQNDRVKATIDERHAKGSRSDYSLWWRYVDKAYSYWGGEDSTVLLYRKDEAVDYFVSRLEQVARAIEAALAPVESTV